MVVGIDGSDAAKEALRVAIREARLRGTRVRAVHVWHVPEGVYLAGFAPSERERLEYEEAARDLLAASVAQAATEASDVPVDQVLRESPAPAPALVEEAETAGLLVVGSRGLSGVREFLLGSVSHACCQHAACPVMLVHDPERAPAHREAVSSPRDARRTRTCVNVMPARTLAEADREVAALLDRELKRQADTLCLIPSENYASAAVLEAMGSVFTNKYSEGYPGRRYYEGQQVVDQLERLTIERAKRLFGVRHANVQPYSGSPANLAVYLAFLQPGDTVMGMALPMGGHLTHGWSVSITGKWFRSIQYGVRRETGRIDLAEVRELARAERPKLIFCGGTAIPRTIDFAGFAEIAHEVGAILVADIAHIAGLIAGGAHPSPVGYADVLSTTTHKSLRGPRGAMLMCDDDDRAIALDRAVFPGLQGGPHNHTTAAIAVALKEASQPEFAGYARQIVSNAQVLAAALTERGFDLVSGGTDNHLILIDLTNKEVPGKIAAQALDRARLTTNYSTVPFDPRKPFDPSGIRLGTPAVTTRGMTEPQMELIARWIDEGIEAAKRGDESVLERIAGEVRELAADFPAPRPHA